MSEQYSENHLNEKDNISFFNEGVFNPKNIAMSNLPPEFKTIGNDRLENMEKGEKVYLTEITKKTFMVERQ